MNKTTNKVANKVAKYWENVPVDLQEKLFLPGKHRETGEAVIKCLLKHLHDDESGDSPQPTAYQVLFWMDLCFDKLLPLEFGECWRSSRDEIEIILKRADELLELLGVETDTIPLIPDIWARPTAAELRQSISAYWAFLYGEIEDCDNFRVGCEKLLAFSKNNIGFLLEQTDLDIELLIRNDDPDDDYHFPDSDRISPINRVIKEIFTTTAPYFDLAIVYSEYVKHVYHLCLNQVDTDVEGACRLLYRNAERKFEEHISFCIDDITDELRVFAGEMSPEEKESLEDRLQVLKRMQEESRQRRGI